MIEAKEGNGGGNSISNSSCVIVVDSWFLSLYLHTHTESVLIKALKVLRSLCLPLACSLAHCADSLNERRFQCIYNLYFIWKVEKEQKNGRNFGYSDRWMMRVSKQRHWREFYSEISKFVRRVAFSQLENNVKMVDELWINFIGSQNTIGQIRSAMNRETSSKWEWGCGWDLFMSKKILFYHRFLYHNID